MTLNESIGRFNVHKTLRFEMKPLGKTAENLDAFLAEDEDRASDLHTIKTLIEAEHLALVRRVFNALPDPLPGYSEIKHSFKRDPAYPVLSGRGTASVIKAIIERCSQTRLKVPKQVRDLEALRGLPEKEACLVGIPHMDALRERLLQAGSAPDHETTILD